MIISFRWLYTEENIIIITVMLCCSEEVKVFCYFSFFDHEQGLKKTIWCERLFFLQSEHKLQPPHHTRTFTQSLNSPQCLLQAALLATFLHSSWYNITSCMFCKDFARNLCLGGLKQMGIVLHMAGNWSAQTAVCVCAKRSHHPGRRFRSWNWT